MRPLNKQAEQKLIAAIENAANRVNAGATPNEAIIKSAAEAEIPAGHINLMVHAYNTGRTTKQREQGEDTLEKSADFQLADIHVVTEALYPKQVKTSGEIVRNSIVSTEYAMPPSGFLARRRSALDKTAAAQVALPAKTYVAPPRDAHFEAMRAHSEKTAAKRAEEESRRVVTATYNKAAAALEELNTYFRTPGNMSFQDAVAEVGLRLGDSGVSVLNKIAAVYPHFEKQAATKLQHFGDNPLYTLVTDVIGSVEAYNGANEAHSSKKANAVSQKAAQQFLTGSILAEDKPLELKQAGIVDYDKIHLGDGRYQGVLYDKKYVQTPEDIALGLPEFMRPVGKIEEPEVRPAVKPPAPGKPPAAGKPSAPAVALPLATGFGSVDAVTAPARAIANSLGLIPSGPGAGPRPGRPQYEALTAVSHESALRDIRARATVHDLMLNDPVVSGYDAADVAQAYNEIADAAPHLSDSPAAMQAMMRKRLESGGLADFDVKQLLEMDRLRADRDTSARQALTAENQFFGGAAQKANG